MWSLAFESASTLSTFCKSALGRHGYRSELISAVVPVRTFGQLFIHVV